LLDKVMADHSVADYQHFLLQHHKTSMFDWLVHARAHALPLSALQASCQR
jgi:hypothetical protein